MHPVFIIHKFNMTEQKEKYITLKEAAKISGYAPDYIGQLIRKGKLKGKQVYCTVAWMTTEDAIRGYSQKPHGKNGNLSLREKLIEKFWQTKTWLVFQMKLASMFKAILYFSIILSVGFSFFLFYIFSVSLDNKLEQNAIERAITNSHTKSH